MLLKGSQIITGSTSGYIKILSEKYGPSTGQVAAWVETFRILKEIIRTNRNFENVEFVFEYEIPFADGKRPDLMMFIRDTVYIIEFKNRPWRRPDDIEQLIAYRDLIAGYHSEGFKYRIKPVLLLNSHGDRNTDKSGINTVSSTEFIKTWIGINELDLSPFRPAEAFLRGRYNPGKDIVSYASDIFTGKKIAGIEAPAFKQAEVAFAEISGIINEARANSIHTLVLVTGEAGSGKSALALRLTHVFDGCYITKNPHFLKLVTSQLGHHCNLHNSTSVIKEAAETNSFPSPNVVLIDEAQRVWNQWRIKKDYRLQQDEIDILLAHVDNKPWSCTVAFIGMAQDLAPSDIAEYHRWPDTFIDGRTDMRKKVFGSVMLNGEQGRFPGKTLKTLHLSYNIRANLEPGFSEAIIRICDDPNNGQIRQGIRGAINTGYKLYITRDLELAKSYLKSHYGNRGLSSCITGTLHYEGFKALDWETSRRFRIEELMKECNLDEMDRTESGLCQFHVLGLEFNMPVIVWKADLLYYNSRWNYDRLDYIENHSNLGYIHNAYRVLLTRGRDGMILYFPDNRKFNSTYHYFIDMGFRKLPNRFE